VEKGKERGQGSGGKKRVQGSGFKVFGFKV
jgi:hypothetical protein